MITIKKGADAYFAVVSKGEDSSVAINGDGVILCRIITNALLNEPELVPVFEAAIHLAKIGIENGVKPE